MRFKIHRARLRWLATLATGLFLGVATATLHSQSAEGPVSPPSITSGELRSVKTSNLGDLDSFVLGPLGSAPAFSPMFNTSITHPDFSESWGYVDDQGNGIPGPNDWENIIPSSVTGNFQSPIDIPVGTPVVDLSGLLNLHYGDSVPHELFNNGHTIELEFEEGANHVSLGGQDFALLQFHFHTPSEHLVNGKQFPMAMHLVHLHENGGLTVIGVLFEEGTVDNPNFAAVFDRISEGRLDNKGDHVEGAEIGIVNPLMLLPSGPLSGYSYVGSLTTPPATEQVNWFVLSQPVRLSKNQIDAYRAAADDVNPANDFNPGARPTQSLAGREFLSSFSGPMFNTSIEHPTFSGSWDYSELPDNGKPGPTDWVSIIPESVTGNFQSPIDIPLDAPIADFTNVIDLHYNEAVPHELFNNGHTIELEFAEGSNLLTLAGHDFELLQFHFHTPSEHTVAGEAFPMAMHLVHASAEGGLTVLGVLFEEGPVDNSNFAPFFEEIAAGHLDNKDDHVEGAELGLINPLNLLPSGSLTGYSYRGSLTTPPATEQVNWFVFNEPIQLSKAQIDAYKAAADDVIQENDFNPGARPVQPLTGRTFNDLVILRDLTVPLQVINFRDDLDMSPGDEFFTGDRPFPVFGRFGDFDHFGIHATGTLLVPADGLWTFGSSSSDGSILRIGGVDVIDDRDNHDARRVFGAIELSAGEHEFEYLMYEQTGAASAELAVALESGDFTDGSGSYVLLSVPECGDCDSDGDGLLDSVELASGTNPANADDALQILVGVLNEETFEVTWNSIPGRAYEVQGSTSLARDSWTTLATVTSDSDSTSAEVGIPWLSRTPMGFFRVRLLEQ